VRAAGADDLEIVRVLGEGGMGEVCLARQPSIGREVAVKRARSDADPMNVGMALVREARLTGMLEHPNVVPVHALGRDAAGGTFFVMKRVEGVSLYALLQDAAHPAWEDLLARHGDRVSALVEVLAQVCDALSYAHARGILHRDVKPENVMVGSYGEVYLVDWGIATDGADGPPQALVGTPAYMAPEMTGADGGVLDARTDVYLLGATLHEALVGRPRHDRATALQALLAAMESAPYAYPPDTPAELAELANASTAREKAGRPASAAAFRQGLARFKRHRASRALSDAAAAALAAAPAEVADPEAARRRHRALSEARFGFRQALREWPENDAALRGLRDALRRMIAHELDVESPQSARSLCEELTETAAAPDAEALARIAALESELTARRGREARIAKLRVDMDTSTTARARAMGFAALGLVVVVSAAVAVSRGVAATTSARGLFLTDLVGVSSFGLAIYAARAKLVANEMGRRLTWAILLQSGFFVLTDLLAVLRAGTAGDALAYRSIGIASAFATLGAMMLPSSRWQAAYMTAAAFVIAAVPEPAALATGAASIVGLIALSSYLFVSGRVKLRPGDTLGE
jgi:serine/threonine-protein kinase